MDPWKIERERERKEGKRERERGKQGERKRKEGDREEGGERGENISFHRRSFYVFSKRNLKRLFMSDSKPSYRRPSRKSHKNGFLE